MTVFSLLPTMSHSSTAWPVPSGPHVFRLGIVFTSGRVTISLLLPLDLITYEVGLERGVNEDVAAQEPVATVVGAHLVRIASSERPSGESPSVGNPPAGQSGCSAGS